MQSIVFLCIENSCRSQIAEAFAKMLGNEDLNVHSAGSKPLGIINPSVYTAFDDIDYNLKNHCSKGINDLPETQHKVVVLMGCGDKCPRVLKTDKVIKWDVPDPKLMSQEGFNDIRDEIKGHVAELLESIGALA